MPEFLNSGWVKELGTSALMFACFYLVLQANTSNLKTLIDSMQNNNNQMFKMYERLFDTVMLNSGMLQKILESVSTNKWCPIVRKYLKKGTDVTIKDLEGCNND